MKKLVLVALLGLASSPAFSSFPLGPVVNCPLNYEPVICSNGCIYDNSCFAAADGATGCVPYTDWV